MAIVKPFKGLRPRREQIDKIAAPPYDVISSEEAKAMAADNGLSFLHISKPEIDLEPKIDLYDERVYEKGKENFQKFIKEGILVEDSSENFYLYRQIMPIGDYSHSQIGLVACASVDEYQQDIIKKHELTRKDKEDDRTKHVFTLQAHTGPVFLTYKAQKSIDSLIEKIEKETPPEYDFTSSDGIRHIFHVVSDPHRVAAIIKEFKKLPHLYVADGHHRSASASRVREMMKIQNPDHSGHEEYNFFLNVIFPDNQMNIMSYNRAVKTLNNYGLEDFLKKVSECWEMKEMGEDIPTPKARHTFGMYVGGIGYLLTPKPSTYNEKDPVMSLDVSILQNNLLSPILGIKEPREDKNIDFIGGIRGTGELKRLVDEGRSKVSFALFPTSIHDLLDVADSQKIMPPKSTWFEPKLKDGLVVHLFENFKA